MLSLPARGSMLPELVCDLLAAGMAASFTATGDSMTPTISHGETIVVEPLGEPAPGMIVLCITGSRLIAHRVIAVGQETLTLQGDASPTPDRPLPRASAVGRVTGVVRGGRTVPPERRGVLVRFWSRVRACVRGIAGNRGGPG